MSAFDPLFDQAKCPVPYVPKVDFRFIDDCEILPSPEPVFDCVDIEIPPETPLPTVTIPPIPLPNICIPCPTIMASANLTVGCSPPHVFVTVTPMTSTGSCDPSPSCAFLFDFDFNIPKPPCPTIMASANLTVTEAADAGVDITVTPVMTATSDSCQSTGCDLIFDFDFRIPLPSLSVSLPSTSLDFPCPTFHVNATAGFAAQPEVNLTIDPVGSNSCEFDVNLEVLFPSTSLSLPSVLCPEFAANAAIAFGDSLAADFIITRDQGQPGNCAFDMDLDITVPCPTLSAGSVTITTGDEPTIDFTITPTGNGANCASTIDMRVVVPTPIQGPPGNDGQPGQDGFNGRDCYYGCYGGYAYCQLWIWCSDCTGSSDSGGSWTKPGGAGGWVEGDPPYPTYSGQFYGDATITCFCPPCASSSSLSSVSDDGGSDGPQQNCCIQLNAAPSLWLHTFPQSPCSAIADNIQPDYGLIFDSGCQWHAGSADTLQFVFFYDADTEEYVLQYKQVSKPWQEVRRAASVLCADEPVVTFTDVPLDCVGGDGTMDVTIDTIP